MLGVIYTIKTANGLYVGSTINFKNRCDNHRDELNLRRYDNILYKNILSNNGIYKIEIYCNVNCRDRRQLKFFEEQYRIILHANLNSYRAFITEDEKRASSKLAQNNFKSKNPTYYDKHYVCECGGKYSYKHKSRHMKTQKHINFINN